ncbi:AAA family ATPase [Stakelama tenebrarum]|uniref:non-specific protein-tyrosine kinase n=1 Tax=Stakelama tenebrarum TaxID=2711215 RepID=A0A6G6Y7J9_9SPHN|nr:AAA family ATPase [Sphingosinithalassobacter tenebrarum]QIG80688.1 AAA family ATPase [Sphingosinithalassobacter tenebrarum]
MNDSTPRRYKGTLIERAAEFYRYSDSQPAQPQPPVQEPPRQVPPARSAFETPQEPAGPVLRPAPQAEPVAENPAPTTPQAPSAPAPAPGGPVPHPGRRQVVIDRDRLAEQGLIVPGGTVTALAEEFRLVKRQLLLTARAVAGADANSARMVLVGSARPNEGKTFCAINLALSLAAEKDVEILLVDADFAKPDVLKRLGVETGPGLLDVLSGAVENVEDCVVETDIPQLTLLPAGTRSASDTELLASDRAHAVLAGLAQANPRRYVIFDTPPVLAASPASVLALHVGQVMLVVRAEQTTETDLREAVAMVDACEHVQLVLNGISFQPGGYRFGNYYEDSGA